MKNVLEFGSTSTFFLGNNISSLSALSEGELHLGSPERLEAQDYRPALHIFISRGLIFFLDTFKSKLGCPKNRGRVLICQRCTDLIVRF